MDQKPLYTWWPHVYTYWFSRIKKKLSPPRNLSFFDIAGMIHRFFSRFYQDKWVETICSLSFLTQFWTCCAEIKLLLKLSSFMLNKNIFMLSFAKKVFALLFTFYFFCQSVSLLCAQVPQNCSQRATWPGRFLYRSSASLCTYTSTLAQHNMSGCGNVLSKLRMNSWMNSLTCYADSLRMLIQEVKHNHGQFLNQMCMKDYRSTQVPQYILTSIQLSYNTLKRMGNARNMKCNINLFINDSNQL